ncbi:hypothetical protein V1478_005468, partial [Vespula squamosa]
PLSNISSTFLFLLFRCFLRAFLPPIAFPPRLGENEWEEGMVRAKKNMRGGVKIPLNSYRHRVPAAYGISSSSTTSLLGRATYPDPTFYRRTANGNGTRKVCLSILQESVRTKVIDVWCLLAIRVTYHYRYLDIRTKK